MSGILEAGTWVGERYRVERFLKEGGFGQVYLAVDTWLEGLVALKALNRARASALLDTTRRVDGRRGSGPMEDFLSEFRVGGAAHHPNLLRYFEVALDGCPPFVTMEWLPEGSLAERMGRGGRPEVEARLPWLLRAFGGACQGVDHLHRRLGIAHCDLKPSNLLLRGGQLLVADFGLVARLGSRLSLPGAAGPGTPGYMSPEQARGQRASPAMDVFALGVILGELLGWLWPPAEDLPCPEALRALAQGMVSSEEAARPSLETVLGQLDAAEGERLSGPQELPFVGRADLLAELRFRWARVAQGAREWVILRGAAGSGKTAAARRFLASLGEGEPALLLHSRCRREEQVSFSVVEGALRDIVHLHLPRLSPDRVRALQIPDLAYLGQHFPFLARALPERSSEQGAGEPHQRRPRPSPPAQEPVEPHQRIPRLATAIAALLSELREGRPILLFIDDAHWASPEGARLVRELLEGSHGLPLMILQTARPGLGPFRPSERILEQTAPDILEVPPMSQAEVTRLIEASGNVGAVGPEGLERLAEAVAALPFYAGPVLALLRDEGAASLATLDAAALRRHALERLVAELTDPARGVLEVLVAVDMPIPAVVAMEVARCAVADRAQVHVELAEARLIVGEVVPGVGLSLEVFHSLVTTALLGTQPPEALRRRCLESAEILGGRGLGRPEMQVYLSLKGGDGARALALGPEALRSLEAASAVAEAADLIGALLASQGPELDALPWRREQARLLALAGRSSDAADVLEIALVDASREARQGLLEARLDALFTAGRIAEGGQALELLLLSYGLNLPRRRWTYLPRAAFWHGVILAIGLRHRRRTPGRDALRKIDIYRSAFVFMNWIEPVLPALFHGRRFVRAVWAGEPYRLAHVYVCEATRLAMVRGRMDARVEGLLKAALTLGEEVRAPWIAGVVMEVRALILLHIGKMMAALEAAKSAEAMLDETLYGLPGEEGQRARALAQETFGSGQWDRARTIHIAALQGSGRLREMCKVLQSSLRHWERRGERYCWTLAVVSVCRYWLLRDNPERARAQVDHMTPAEGAGLGFFQQIQRRVAYTEILLYEDAAPADLWALWAGVWGSISGPRWSLNHFQRIYAFELTQRMASVCALRPPPGLPFPLHAPLRRAIRSLRRVEIPWAQGVCQSARSTLALVEGDRAGALRAMETARLEFCRDGYTAYDAALGLRMSELMEGPEADALRASSLGWFTEQGAENPEAMARVFQGRAELSPRRSLKERPASGFESWRSR